jgi:hypothetical protein
MESRGVIGLTHPRNASSVLTTNKSASRIDSRPRIANTQHRLPFPFSFSTYLHSQSHSRSRTVLTHIVRSESARPCAGIRSHHTRVKKPNSPDPPRQIGDHSVREMHPPDRVGYTTFAAHAGGRSPQPPSALPTSTSHPRARRDSTAMERRRGSGPSPGLTTEPKSTTTTSSTAISSGSQRHSPGTTSAATASPSGVSRAGIPAAGSPPSPRDRLERLINTITCVLRCYAALPTRSPAFLDSLESFRERAIGMYQQVSAGSGAGTGTRIGVEAQTTAAVGSGGSGVGDDVSGSSPSLECAVINAEVDAPVSSQHPRGAITARPGFHTALGIRGADGLEAPIAPHDLSSPPCPSPSYGLNQVDALEKEWWDSEVVAAWFGPRPGCFTGAGRTRSGERQGREREGAGVSRRLDLRRDTSYVGLYDE